MKGSLLLFLLLWIFWSLLGGFDIQEIVAGFFASLFVSAIVGYGFLRGKKVSYLKGFFFFMIYIPYYVYQEVISVIDTVYRILTGEINPGIVKVKHYHTHDWGLTVLSNSITMTPGTLTLDATPRYLYVHWLNMKGDKESIALKFEKILKHIWH